MSDSSVTIAAIVDNSVPAESLAVAAKPKQTRKRKADKENVDPLAEVKPKRTRAVAAPKEPKAPRVKKEKPVMRVLRVDDHDSKESFEIPAYFTCSSCKQPHSIAEHVKPLATSSKVFQTCQDCRDKGVEFYRRQLRLRVTPLDDVKEAEGDVAVAGACAELVEVDA